MHCDQRSENVSRRLTSDDFPQHELVNLDNLDYSYHDSTMSQIGVTPNEVELTIPSFVTSDRADEIAYWEMQMNAANSKLRQASTDVSCTAYTVCKYVRRATVIMHGGNFCVLTDFWFTALH